MTAPDAPQPRRVHHVITRLILGGAQENTVSSVLGLARMPEFSLRLISGPTTGPEGSIVDQVSGTPDLLTVTPHLIRKIHPLLDWYAYRDLTRLFRNEKPHIVHTHSGKAGILGRLAARKAGVPIILHTIHGPSFGPFQGRLANAVFTRAEKVAARCTDHFVVVANAMARQYQEAGIGRPVDYTRVFSGFDLDPFLNSRPDPVLAARFGIQPGDFVLGKIARLFALKGHEDLFLALPELVRRVPRLKLLLVGDGPWRPRFEAEARASGLADRVIFAGLVPPSQVGRHIALMDAVVHLSRREGLARVLPQSLACGKPIVAYDCDGASEVCIDGETGFLIAPDDLNALVNRVGQLADAPELAHDLGLQGRGFVVDRFPTQRMVDDLAVLYRGWLERKGIRNSAP
jgi:glycosyltransferase involved in cell wall biosynthesis